MLVNQNRVRDTLQHGVIVHVMSTFTKSLYIGEGSTGAGGMCPPPPSLEARGVPESVLSIHTLALCSLPRLHAVCGVVANMAGHIYIQS